ncbi:Craniofacial development protein 2 [Stylophora pistillata]|uniref:Craniofacial development protein 2 n=1 Tax=Stylophora pistillata TaxID=50429 RepID=A0A2B4RR40_STYPI|nr:Craniofacial development protein 2 [Stylophora pistillata]
MDTNTNRPERRTAFVARELKRLDFDIVALSETRRAEKGQLSEEQGNYTFFIWKGKAQDQLRIHGVGFAIRNYLLTKLTEQPVGINERLITLRIGLKRNQNGAVISAYAPTLDAEEKVKEAFYADLDESISATPTQYKLIILGDVNARVGRNHNIWEGQVALKSEDGATVLKTNKEVNARWREHFEGLFNQETTYNADVINLIAQQPIKQSLCDTPALDEVKKTILRINSNKAAGPDGIP